ncbi:MAG: NAD(P)H-binding protein, partial [Acidimicrobiia bacterium]|nr:NAD(P)H-binding protein [Acidimicrobiia bacterium]
MVNGARRRPGAADQRASGRARCLGAGETVEVLSGGVGTVLVTGGTGVLGSYLVPRLVGRGHHVRTLSRHPLGASKPSTSSPTARQGVDNVRGDVRTGEGVEAAAAGCDTVVHAATNAGWRARETEVEGTRHVAEAARRAGAHLLYVSIVGVDRHRLPYYRAKWAAEQVVEASGAGWTILRATQFHEL